METYSGMILTGQRRRTREKTLSHCHYVHHKSNMERPGHEPGLRVQKPVTNRLSHATAKMSMLVFSLRRWRQYVPPKRFCVPTSPHGVTIQKTNNNTLSSARTSNLTKYRKTRIRNRFQDDCQFGFKS